jgi:putative transposase
MSITPEIVNQLIEGIKTSEELLGPEGLIKQLTKQLFDRVLQAEMTHHLGYEKHAKTLSGVNSRNGMTTKKVKTGQGELEITVPRGRESSFEPQLIGKRQTRLSGFNEQILSLYSRGMTVRDIQEHLKEIYGTDVSADLISSVTDAVLEEVTAWRNRPIERLYPIVFIDGFVAKLKAEGRITNHTVYVVFGITLSGYKEVLGFYLSETEGAKYWLNVLTQLKHRGLDDVFVICADGLKGLSESVSSAFPKAIFQTCIVHMVRHSLNYVPYKEKKAVAVDLRAIYNAATPELGLAALDDFELTWGDKYAVIVKSWRNNWEKITPFFDFPAEIRRVIYTTNIIESLNASLRKSVRNRGHFSTEDALMKVLYLTTKQASKKWTMPVRNWSQALNQFAIMFAERFPNP